MSLKELADATSQKHQSVARHETGLNQMTLAQMEVYARALKIKPEELLNGSARINPELRELMVAIDKMPPADQQRFLRMGQAFAEPQVHFLPEPQHRTPRRRRS